MARESAGMLQADLAKALRVNPSAVSHWESGRRKPRTMMLARIAAATGADVNWLWPSGALAADEREFIRTWRRLSPAAQLAWAESFRNKELLAFCGRVKAGSAA